jgi:hypothetical protein
MKIKLIIAALLATIAFQAQAQTLPNSGFENWTIQQGGWEDPDSWVTNNDSDHAINSISVRKTTDSYTGNYALQVINNWHFLEPGPLPGYAILVFSDSNIVSKISAFVKCDTISGSGKGIIAVYGYLGGLTNALLGRWETTVEMQQYTQIQIPLSPLNYFDSIRVELIGFAEIDQLGTSTGFAMLKVDQITKEVLTGLEEWDSQQIINTVPNPFSESAIISFEGQMGKVYLLSIYDSEGNLVESDFTTMHERTILERRNLSPGAYHFQIHYKSTYVGSGKFIIQ